MSELVFPPGTPYDLAEAVRRMAHDRYSEEEAAHIIGVSETDLVDLLNSGEIQGLPWT